MCPIDSLPVPHLACHIDCVNASWKCVSACQHVHGRGELRLALQLPPAELWSAGPAAFSKYVAYKADAEGAVLDRANGLGAQRAHTEAVPKHAERTRTSARRSPQQHKALLGNDAYRNPQHRYAIDGIQAMCHSEGQIASGSNSWMGALPNRILQNKVRVNISQSC